MSALNTLIQYDHSPKILVNGTVNWLNDTLKLALVSNAYTPDTQHTQWADVSAHLVGTAATLTNPSIDDNKMTADNLTLANLTATFRYIVLYAEGAAKGPDSLQDPLIGMYDLGADIVVESADYPISFSTNGAIALARA